MTPKSAETDVLLRTEVRTKSKCPLCKMLNMISELKRHPNESGFLQLARRATMLIKERKGLSDICEAHRIPLRLNVDVCSIADYVNEVRHRAHQIVDGEIRVKNYEEGKRRLME